jgi:polyhydroxyalkanoate synthesis regulator phasin
LKLRETIKKGAMEAFGFEKANTAKKPWITERMLENIDERRKRKSINTDEGRKAYRRLNNALRRETDKAREKWWEAISKELKEHDRIERSDLMYYEVRRLTKAERK